jgi:hypothetical protein
MLPAPLFRDPIHDGAADPTIIWNRHERAWWLVYTNRRANVPCRGFAWVHGTDLGIASSNDGGQSWRYRGALQGLNYEPGRNTYWAPEILRHDGRYHMYVSYVPGVPHDWSGPRYILHYTSDDLWIWMFQSKLALSSERVIDACVHRLPNGVWRMWYKDEASGSHTYAADSDDLYAWRVRGPVITDCPHEGPNVFFWQGRYWMVTDPWDGLGVYVSDDAEHWMRQPNILRQPGVWPDDGSRGLHADVLVQGNEAFIFYFTHPERRPDDPPLTFDDVHPYAKNRTSIQVARLRMVKGVLTCDRDEMIDTIGEGE